MAARDQLRHHAERLSAAVTSLLAKLCPGPFSDKQEFRRNLIVLSRLIDCAVACTHLPSSTADLVNLLKLIWLQKSDLSLRPAIMVLLISVKSACHGGWFKAADAEELLSNFSTFSEHFVGDGCLMQPPKPGSPPSLDDTFQLISKINSRFFPWFAASSVVLSVETKPGYEVLICDFNVTQPRSQQERLLLRKFHPLPPPWLAAALCVPEGRRDIIVPNLAAPSKDTGPQVPTDVTHLLRVGCNLLQVVGEFTESYVIAVALVATVDHATSVELQEYVAPTCTIDGGLQYNSHPDMDDDVIEGPSRVSLLCPISHKRIATPAKGVSCKHHQCFDFHNFIEINERRPAWRCPYCNTPVSFPDLRLDRHMAKVIKEAAEKVKDVMILPDGSWEPTPYREELEEPTYSSESNLFEKVNSVDSDQFAPPVIDLSLEGESRNSVTEDVGSRNGAGKLLEERDVKPDISMDISAAGSIFVKDLHTFPSTVLSTGLARLENHDQVSLPSSPLETGSRVLDETDASIYGSGSHLTYSVSGGEQESGETSPARISLHNQSAQGRVGGISGAQTGYSFDIFPTGEGIAAFPGFGRQGWSEAVHQQVWPTNAVEAAVGFADIGSRARVTSTYMPNDSGGSIRFAPILLQYPYAVSQEGRDDTIPEGELPMLP